MKAMKKQENERPSGGDWLYLLLLDIDADAARQPSLRAVARMKRRLQVEIKMPVKAAA